jgi:hypothetical protein
MGLGIWHKMPVEILCMLTSGEDQSEPEAFVGQFSVFYTGQIGFHYTGFRAVRVRTWKPQLVHLLS